MPLEDLHPLNNYITYEQLQKLLTERLGALEREIEAKLLQLRESRFNYLEEKIELKAELEALKEQFKILNSEFITRVTNLSYKVLEINNFFTQKLAELNQQFVQLNASLISEFEKYKNDFYEFLKRNDLKTFFENNADLIPYLFSPMLNEFKDRLSAIEKNLNLIQNFYANISAEINKQVDEILKTTLDKIQETLINRIRSLEITAIPDIAGFDDLKNEIIQSLNNLQQDVNELKSSIPNASSDNAQILNEINSKLDEIKNAQYTREFVVPEVAPEMIDMDAFKKFSEEVKSNLELLRKISEEISTNASSLIFTPSIDITESLKPIDAQLNQFKSTLDEVATSQFEIQNNMANFIERINLITSEISNTTKTVKKDTAESLQVVKAELLKELKAQKQDIITAFSSVSDSIQSLKGLPFFMVFLTVLIIAVIILTKFVF